MKEFGGFGRTWWMAILVIGGTTLGFFLTDKIDVVVWKEIIMVCMATGGLKSAVQKFAENKVG